jgi:hypothetical protein
MADLESGRGTQGCDSSEIRLWGSDGLSSLDLTER